MTRRSKLLVFFAAAVVSSAVILVSMNRSIVGARSEALALKLAGHSLPQKQELIDYVESLQRSAQGRPGFVPRNKSDVNFPVIGVVPEYGVSFSGNAGRLTLEGSYENGVSMEFQFDKDGRVSEAFISRGESKESWPYWRRDEHP